MVEVRPFKGLTTNKHQTANNGSSHPTDHFLFGISMTGLYSQYHRYRTHDEDKGHDTDKNQWVAIVRYKGDRLEHLVWVHPRHVGKPLCPIVNQKRGKRERIGSEEKPHHDLLWGTTVCPHDVGGPRQ